MSVVGGTTREVLQTPGFKAFWSALSLSRAGDLIMLIALASTGYALTASAFVTVAAVLIVTLPSAMGVFGGVVADALGHRRAMVVGNVLRAVFVASVPLLLALQLPLLVIYAVVLLTGISAAVYMPARGAIVPSILPTRTLQAGNSLVHGSDRIVEVLGALVGGLLFSALVEYAFLASALAFATSALIIGRLPFSETSPRPLSLRGTLREAVEGLRYIYRSDVLRPLTTFTVSAFLLLLMFNGLLPVLIFRAFAPSDPVQGASLFGVAQGAIAVGAIAASVLYPNLFAGMRSGPVMLGGFVVFGLLMVLLALVPLFELALVILFLFGFANVVLLIPNLSVVQRVTPAEIRARVLGARVALISLAALPAGLLGGVLADRVPVAVLISVAGLFTAAVAIVGTRFESLWSLE